MYPKILTSSADPEKLSLTVKGFLMSLIPLAMVMGGFTEAELGAFVDAIVQLVYLAASLAAAIQVVIGLARKLYFKRWSAK